MFGGPRHSDKARLSSRVKASEGVSPLDGAQAHLGANFVSYLLAASEHCRSLGVGRGLRVCGGECALCVCLRELTPKQRFSPLLSATTRMYHHVAVDWIVLRLQCDCAA